VVLYHAKITGLTAGYLGVDIFFVISGFLITGLIKSSIEKGDFRFSTFYYRRAKRLLPAAYVVFLITALLAPFILNSRELADFSIQMLGAVTFTGNIALWQQTGYFEGAGELKPLLHVWSLSIEEQYYFLLPVTLVCIAPRRWLPLALLILSVSLLLCMIGSYWKPVATFYLLPTRAWELAMGSIGALIAREHFLYRLSTLLFIPALIVLAVVPFMPIGGFHPGWDALLVCFATLLVILRRHEILNSIKPVRLLARVGNFSYSLYLVHWPMFAFANNAWVGHPHDELPFAVRITAVTLSFVLAYLLYLYVEKPIHQAELRFSPKLLARTLIGSFALVIGTIGVAKAMSGGTNYEQLRRVNYGFGEACEYSNRFEPKAECRNSDTPTILVWGDSYAMHWIPGILATAGDKGIVQATRSACGPMLGIAAMEKVTRKGYNRKWAEDCIAFNQSVIDYLANAPSIDIVVLASPFRAYLDNADYANLQLTENEYTVVTPSLETALAALKRTVHSIRALGKRVVVLAPPPSGNFDIGSCLERRASGKFFFGASHHCEISAEIYRQSSAILHDFLSRIPIVSGTNVISLDAILCDEFWCKTEMDGILFYRDIGHLSYSGSEFLAKHISLTHNIDRLAI
jgi:peptidoglycan/LPS O-acetylase OafA/YrhL